MLVPLTSLTLRYPGELPVLILDGTTNLVHYPDHFIPMSIVADSMCLRDLTAERVAPMASDTPMGAAPSHRRPTTPIRAQLAARVEAAGASVGADNRSVSRVALVRSPDTA